MKKEKIAIPLAILCGGLAIATTAYCNKGSPS